MLGNPIGKVALVTGGATGIGRAVVERFLNAGMRVVIASRRQSALDSAAAELDAGERLHTVCCDVSRLEGNVALAEETVDRYGGVNVAHFNAGAVGEVDGWGASEVTTDAWRLTLATNLDGPFYGMRAFLPLLEQQEEAHFVFTASSFALIPTLGDPAPYFVSKAGLLSFAECLYHDLSERGSHIGVTCLLPGNTFNGPYYELLELLRSTENDPEAWDSTWGPRDHVAHFIDHFTRNGTGAGVLADDLMLAMAEDRFYVTSNIGGHWKYIEERWANIRACRNPTLGDRSPDVLVEGHGS